MFVLSEFHVIRTIKNTRSIEGGICCFHVNHNFVFNDFVLTEFLVGSFREAEKIVVFVVGKEGTMKCSLTKVSITTSFLYKLQVLISLGHGPQFFFTMNNPNF